MRVQSNFNSHNFKFFAMSDRFVMHAAKEQVEELFGVATERKDYFDPHYNITPGTLIPAVRRENGERIIHNFIWGLIPPDADDERKGSENYEIPAEEKGREEWIGECFESRRCIIPASGFYKWKTTEKKSTPFYIRLLSSEVMGLAGIYSVWKSSSGRDVFSCAQLTTQANALVQPVDDRMPVILNAADFEQWLDPETDPAELERLLEPYSMVEMAVNRVSDDVNNVTNNSPELIQPIPK